MTRRKTTTMKRLSSVGAMMRKRKKLVVENLAVAAVAGEGGDVRILKT